MVIFLLKYGPNVNPTRGLGSVFVAHAYFTGIWKYLQNFDEFKISYSCILN